MSIVSESVRELVVKLSMDTDKFNTAAKNIQAQIKNVKSEFNALGTSTDTCAGKVSTAKEKLASLTTTLELQKNKISVYTNALAAANKQLGGATTDAGKLAAANKATAIETQLNNAKAAAIDLEKQIAQTQATINAMKFTEAGAALTALGTRIRSIGRSMSLYITAPLAMLGGKAYTTANDYESAFAGVKKTVNATNEEFDALYESLLDLSEVKPTSFVDLAKIMEVAGQLGVPIANMREFTSVAADLSESTDLSAEQAATQLAKLLKITQEGDYSNIERVGSVLVGLGNDVAATESEILDMATRMAAAGSLTGFDTTQILALAASFTELGINAEAGGSAAGKLMKKMEVAAKTGEKAKDIIDATGMSLRELQLMQDADSKGFKAIAQGMGLTSGELKDYMGSLQALNDFASVMGMTTEQFAQGWDASPIDTILGFFSSLGDLDESGVESVVTVLDNMGLTEIRLSNLIGAAAKGADGMAANVELAGKSYADNAALAEEAGKRYETQSAQNDINMNKIENTMADAGENIVDMIQPIIDKIVELIQKFGELSEQDQSKVISAFACFAAAGPIVTAIGATVGAIGKVSTGIGNIIQGKSKWQAALTNMLGSNAFWGLTAGAGILLLVSTLASISTDTQKIVDGLSGLEISIDEDSKNATLKAIADVRNATDALSGETGQKNAGTSRAVKAGYGTSSMFGTALEYERQLAESEITDLSSQYGVMIDNYNAKIAEAVLNGDTSSADKYAAARDKTQTEWDAQVAASREGYTRSVNDLINGMMAQQPEQAKKLREASDIYDLMARVYDANANAASSEEGPYEYYNKIFTKDVLDKYFNGNSFDDVLGASGGDYATIGTQLYEILNGKLNESVMAANDGSLAYTLLSSMLSSDGATDMLDMSALDGAAEGIVKTLDFKGASAAAKEKGSSDIGAYISLGVGSGILDNAGAVTPGVNAIRDATVTSLRAAFQMHSPSRLMAQEGINIPLGIASGILSGTGAAVSAIAAMGAAMQAEAARQAAMIRAILASAFSFSGRPASFGAWIGAPTGALSGLTVGSTVNIGTANFSSSAQVTALSREIAFENKRILAGIGQRG